MAIKAYEYLAIGEQLFKAGGLRPVGDSWQVKAQQKGFDEASARHAKPYSLGDLVREQHKKNSSGVVHHILFLRAEYECEMNSKRAKRLYRKANKLAEKHGFFVPQSL